jgi:hypothetical protein
MYQSRTAHISLRIDYFRAFNVVTKLVLQFLYAPKCVHALCRDYAFRYFRLAQSLSPVLITACHYRTPVAFDY